MSSVQIYVFYNTISIPFLRVISFIAERWGVCFLHIDTASDRTSENLRPTPERAQYSEAPLLCET